MKLDVSMQNDYVIATALTGSGLDLPRLKRVFTGRIRAVCGCQLGFPLVREDPMVAEDVPCLMDEIAFLQDRYTPLVGDVLCHWASHACQAAKLLDLWYMEYSLVLLCTLGGRMARGLSDEDYQLHSEKLQSAFQRMYEYERDVGMGDQE